MPALFANPVSKAAIIDLPAGVSKLANPSAVYYDVRRGEMYVADTGNSRIVIFDKNGLYNFEFSDREHMGAPLNVAVDSTGRIYVQSDRNSRSLSVYDYDGTYLRELPLFATGDTSATRLSSFAIDEQDQIYALMLQPTSVHVVNTGGQLVKSFALFTEKDFVDEDRRQPVLGSLSLINGKLVIPYSMVGYVIRFTTDGKFSDIIGTSGGGPGELSLPVAVAPAKKGGILVLDKHRSTILHFSDGGRFIAEYGGAGMSAGWFYHPVSLCANQQGEYFVVQSSMDRLQMVQLENTGDQVPADGIAAQPAKGEAPAAEQNQRER